VISYTHLGSCTLPARKDIENFQLMVLERVGDAEDEGSTNTQPPTQPIAPQIEEENIEKEVMKEIR
jgi:hypothetical protein